VVSILNKCVSFYRGKKHGAQNRDNGREYETLQAVKRCRKPAYCAFNNPSKNSDTLAHFLASVIDHFENALRDFDAANMVGITIQNRVTQNDKPIGTSF